MVRICENDPTSGEGRTDAGVMTIKKKRIGPDVGVIPFEERPVFGMENENRLWTWDVRGRRKTHSWSTLVIGSFEQVNFHLKTYTKLSGKLWEHF